MNSVSGRSAARDALGHIVEKAREHRCHRHASLFRKICSNQYSHRPIELQGGRFNTMGLGLAPSAHNDPILKIKPALGGM
jgi:hypothetical protein